MSLQRHTCIEVTKRCLVSKLLRASDFHSSTILADLELVISLLKFAAGSYVVTISLLSNSMYNILKFLVFEYFYLLGSSF